MNIAVSLDDDVELQSETVEGERDEQGDGVGTGVQMEVECSTQEEDGHCKPASYLHLKCY